MLVFFLLLLLLGAGAAVTDAVYRTAAVVVAAGPPCRQVKSKLAMSSSCSAVRATQPSFHPFIHADRQLTSQPASQTTSRQSTTITTTTIIFHSPPSSSSSPAPKKKKISQRGTLQHCAFTARVSFENKEENSLTSFCSRRERKRMKKSTVLHKILSSLSSFSVCNLTLSPSQPGVTTK